jgi:NitT/TauT family transport system permease protein
MWRNRSLSGYVPAALLFVVLIAAWQAALPLVRIPEILVPRPSRIAAVLVSPTIHWSYHIGVTAFEALVGFLCAVILGIGLAVAVVMSRWLERLLMPYILLAQIVPKMAFAPIFFLLLGYNLAPTIVITFLVCFFPMVIDTATGLASVDPNMRDLLRSLQASRWDILRKAELPASLPYIFSGLKVSSTLAVVGAIVAEFVSAKAGLGFLILNAQLTFNSTLAFAAATHLVLLGAVFYGVIVVVERLSMPWARGRASR